MYNRSILFAIEPQWSDCRPLNYRHIPSAAHSWLFEAGSITQRLRSIYGDSVRVKVLRQRWDKPFLGEKKLLGLAQQRRCLIREVLLHSDDTPLVLARTVIAAKTLRGSLRSLARLGNRPLGEVIFSYPHLERSEMQIARVKTSDWSPRLVEQIAMPEPLWGRRTVYAVHRRQLLVTEVFLPELISRF